MSEQRHSEAAWATLDSYLDRAPVGFALLDDELRFVRVNAALARVTGLSEAEHLGQRPGRLLGEVGARIEAEVIRVRDGGPAQGDLELRGILPSRPSRRRAWLLSCYRVALPDGDALGTGATIVDVTDHLEVEQELTAQRDLYETILRAQSQMGEAFMLLDGARAIYVNQAAEAVSGRSAQELYDLASVVELVPEGQRPALYEELGRTMAQPDGLPGLQTVLVLPDGRHRPVELSAQALGADGGRRAVLVARDVTERRRAESEREQLLEAERAARHETERAHRDARLLATLGAALDRSLELSEMLPEVAQLLLGLGVDVLAIDVLPRGGQQLKTVASAASDPERARQAARLHGRTYDLSSDHPRAVTARARRALYQPSLPEGYLAAMADDDADLELLAAVAPVASAVVPLVARGRTVGVLALGWDDPAGLPEPDARHHLDEVARRLALGVDNAQLYAERAHVASTLQAGLLPQALPEIPGAEVAARYRPAGFAAEVGGDFYDVFASGPDRWTIVVGDVCGKGAEAAAVTALARHTLRAASVAGATQPAAALALLNETMAADLVDERFLTVVVGSLDLGVGAEATLRLACAGHPAPVVVRADGRVEAVAVAGPLVGAVRGLGWVEGEVQLAAGEAVVLVTDGVTEADRRAPLDPRGLAAAVATALGGAPARSAEDLSGAIEALARERADGPLRDDVAIVALRIDG